MKTLSIDIETYSDQPLAKTGVYRYVESSYFEILLFSYSVDGGPVRLVDLACGEQIPTDIVAALEDDSVTKWAFNANFERICLSRHLGYPTGDYLEPDSWKCSMVWAATMGLPLSLEGVGSVLGLEKQKLTEGKDLIKYFCQPCAPTKSNGQRTRNLPAHAPDKWLAFKKYNIRDVETEMSIQARLAKYPVPDSVWDEYHIDQEINDRGVALDMELVQQAIQMDGRSRSELTQAMKDLTALENPNSVQQMKQWLSDNGMETDTLGKKAVAEMLKTAPPELQKVLTLRQQLAKSSVKKYQAMEIAVCADGRARGMFQFYGANRTGRWAGRIIQMQNLPQNHLEDLAEARGLVRCGAFDALEMLYEDVPDTLSQLIRTAFIPQGDRKLIVADFSAIEARVIAWLAREEWRQRVFAEGKDIYCASASQMFGVPVEKHGINGHLRQKGKIAELALGYGGSVGALKAMGALEMGLSEEELPPLVDAWRQANPNITKLWWDVDRAAMEAVRYKHTNETRGIEFSCRSGMLFITLPSGRQLSYVKPKVGTNKFGGDCKLGHTITTSGERKINIAATKPAAAWIDEGEELTWGDAKFAQINLDAHKLHVAVKVTEELLYDNAFQLEKYILRQFAKALANAEEDAFLNGTGVGQPLGLLAEEGGAQIGVTAASATEITADELIDLVYSLKRPYRKNAKFICNDQTLAAIRKLTDKNGRYLWQDSVQAGEPGRLLGYEVHTSPYFPVITAGMPAIAFGDYNYYNIGDRGTRSFAELKELFAGNGMVGFVAKERVDGKLILPEAVKLLKMATA